MTTETKIPAKRSLPETRQALTHPFDIAGHKGHITVGLYPDGTPGELFITMVNEGSTIGGLVDSIASITSLSLQYGVPLEELINKMAGQRFEPSGFTKNPEISNTSSITDYVFRWLKKEFIPNCPSCGQTMVKNETYFKCTNCGESAGGS